MQIVPLSPVPAQTFAVVLGSQHCKINLYQKTTGMFLDLYVSSEKLLAGVLCRDMSRLVRQPHLGFVGDLAFMDTQGSYDPHYQGLGSRYVLMYLEPVDLG
ncbi:hypothetical protein [Pseudomonas sp. GV071]|uniref:phage baseplate plug family protein n=1 Tax=Pseudomonas sp. GV071 TaxID=2135754 RepID=UPI000D332A79|nr:hypothetical protein [Pseudomonas sp. GV071]PTQ70288.1 hypothetical protein C8K61_10610 [Pseudomonas sp. GV071]